tara:strand:- start:17310 stop:18083 length:774 start_codon:yes stop_codon:yes gene_type:complete
MDITAYIMGISPPQRLLWLKNTIDYMDSQQFPFKKKIVSIDQVGGDTVQSDLVEYFESKGWVVLIDNHQSRVLSMNRAFEMIDTDLIFYNEDDVMAKLPKYEDVKNVFENRINGRECGMLSMTLGGTQYDAASGNIGDLRHMEENTILANEEYRIFLRMEQFKNTYFFEFPGLFVKTDLFKECHFNPLQKGIQIEQSLSLTYLAKGFESKYFKASLCKKNALPILLEDGSKVNSHCRLLTNLDPEQGNSPLGGGHWY